MDCVGCEKCRLWGKLQVLGLGTALNILFSVNNYNDPAQRVSFNFWFSDIFCSQVIYFFVCKIVVLRVKLLHFWSNMSIFWVLLVLQLQLHRNEVIALVNLLNRLSESIKFVHEKGPLVESLMKDLPSEYSAQQMSLWRRLWETTLGGYVH